MPFCQQMECSAINLLAVVRVEKDGEKLQKRLLRFDLGWGPQNPGRKCKKVQLFTLMCHTTVDHASKDAAPGRGRPASSTKTHAKRMQMCTVAPSSSP